MTFDQRFVGLNLNYEQLQNGGRNGRCSYLLAHDFFKRNFTLLLEPAVRRDLLNSFALTDNIVQLYFSLGPATEWPRSRRFAYAQAELHCEWRAY